MKLHIIVNKMLNEPAFMNLIEVSSIREWYEFDHNSLKALLNDDSIIVDGLLNEQQIETMKKDVNINEYDINIDQYQVTLFVIEPSFTQ